MKKSFALLLALLVVSVAGFTAAHITLDGKKTAVKLEQTILYGDETAAEGLKATLNSIFGRNIAIATHRNFGAGAAVGTSFQYSRKVNDYTQPAETYMYIAPLAINPGFVYGENNEELAKYGMNKVFLNISAETKLGEQTNKTVYLHDYFDYFELWVEAYSTNGALGYNSTEDLRLSKAISDYLRIPVPEDCWVNVQVDRRQDSPGINRSITSMSEDIPTFDNYCCADGGNLYFAFSDATDDGKTLLDTRHIKGGYGIFRLPLGKDKNGTTQFDADKLDTAYPLKPGTRINGLYLSKDGARLLLITREDGGCVLTVIDIKTMTQLQRTELFKLTDLDYPSQFRDGGNYVAATSGLGSVTLLEMQNDGTYEREIASSLPAELRYTLAGDYSFAWDGERLCLSSLMLGGSAPGEAYKGGGNTYGVMVFGAEGLRFAAVYDSSLNVDAADTGDYYCGPRLPGGVEVGWQ